MVKQNDRYNSKLFIRCKRNLFVEYLFVSFLVMEYLDELDIPAIIRQLYVVITLVCVTSLASFILRKFKANRNGDLTEFTPLCKSTDCVRCFTYERIRKRAKHKLHDFCFENPEQNVRRVKQGFEDKQATTTNLEGAQLLQKPNVFYLPGLLAKPWWESHDVDISNLFDINAVLKHYSEFVEEYENVSKSDIGWVVNSVPSGEWRAFHLINQGRLIDSNTRMCPNTISFVNGITGLMAKNVFGNVLFSVLAPGTETEEHCGPTNIRLRLHIGLQVPEGSCELTVNKISKQWQRKQCLLFDDSFLHSARYNLKHGCSESRAVLMIDLWHPHITATEKQALDYIFEAKFD